MALLVSCGALVGHHLDKKWGSAPWLLLLGVMLGSAGALVNALRILNHLQARNARAGGRETPAAAPTATNDERPPARGTDDAT